MRVVYGRKFCLCFMFGCLVVMVVGCGFCVDLVMKLMMCLMSFLSLF